MNQISRRSALKGSLATFAVGALPLRARAATTVTIAMQNGIGYLPIIVADALGLFGKAVEAAGAPGTQVVVKKFSGAPAINDGLLSNTIQLGAMGTPGMLVAWEKTRGSYDIRGLTPLSMGRYALYTSKPEVKTVADFPDSSRIAVTALNTPQAILLRMAAEKQRGEAGIRRFDKMMVSLPHPDAATMMASGSTAIDGYFANDPFITVLEANPKLHVVTTSEEILGHPATSGLLATTGKFMTEQPAVAKGIVAAIAQAEDFIKAKPAEAGEIYLKSEPFNLSKDALTAMIRDNKWSTEPHGIMAYASFMTKIGMLKKAPARWQDTFFAPVANGAGD
ncbi:ABC transporter substrate-binding protein [Bosea sp. TAB14]|uniref:ABC transporter substrate-binding protein n=1 Tax=Bosea sp. TAB14 TaxID=3237481 RepID=UPI003F915B55